MMDMTKIHPTPTTLYPISDFLIFLHWQQCYLDSIIVHIAKIAGILQKLPSVAKCKVLLEVSNT